MKSANKSTTKRVQSKKATAAPAKRLVIDTKQRGNAHRIAVVEEDSS